MGGGATSPIPPEVLHLDKPDSGVHTADNTSCKPRHLKSTNLLSEVSVHISSTLNESALIEDDIGNFHQQSNILFDHMKYQLLCNVWTLDFAFTFQQIPLLVYNKSSMKPSFIKSPFIKQKI